MTVSMLARRCGLSRSTLLYYESIGLLRRPPRTTGNYRAYGDADLADAAGDDRAPEAELTLLSAKQKIDA